MFIDNKYKKWYVNIIKNASGRIASSNMIAITGRRSNKEWIGKTPFELGFGVE